MIAVGALVVAGGGASAVAAAPRAHPNTSSQKPPPHPTPRVRHDLRGPIIPGYTHGMPARRAHSGASAASPATPDPSIPPTADDNLAYTSGPIMKRTTTYLIFWDPGNAVISQAVRDLETQFLQDLGGAYYGIMSQYYGEAADGSEEHVTPITNFGGSWDDSSTAYPHAGTTSDPLTDGDMRAEVRAAILANPDWNQGGLTSIYEVVVGEHVEFCEDSNHCTSGTPDSGICAYHGTFSVNGTDVIYASDGNDAGRNCGSTSPSPNDSDADADVSTLSHETFEAITDPLGDAWRTPQGKNHQYDEIGDLCQYYYGTPDENGANLTLNGHAYRVQLEWSNEHADLDPTASWAGCDVVSGAINSVAATSPYPACTANTLSRNDDLSTEQVTLPFNVNFFSQNFSSLWVNNNGNVTFDEPQYIYTPYGLASTTHEIIAPYFADVDTRDPGSREVTYGGEAGHDGRPGYFCVNWVNVGYYGNHSDRLDSFQLLLIDRSTQTGVQGDFDIVFNYDKLQWETGDASSGSGGLGGNSAVVGYSNGSNASLELPGSGVNGFFLDDGAGALIQGSRGSSTPGRYIFPVRNGSAAIGGVIHGAVTTDLGQTIIRGAPVQVCGVANGLCILTQSNEQGRYSVTGLPADTYNVSVMPAAGSYLLPLYISGIQLAANGDAAENLDLYSDDPLPPLIQVDYHRVTSDGVPVIEWGTDGKIHYSGQPGCSVTAIFALNDGSMTRTVNLTPDQAGYEYTGAIPDFEPHAGAATVTVTAVCNDTNGNDSENFSVYIDPSGVVVDQTGAPVVGAQVALLRADNPDGPFSAVPDGSPLMSPANRNNPDATTSDGTFGWDVVTGYYKVQASKAGCVNPSDVSKATVTSDAFAVPPAMPDLRLILNCDTTAPTIATTPVSIEENTVNGYVGDIPGVTITDPDDPTDSLTVSNDAPSPIPPGTATITWTAQDPAGNVGTATQTVTVTAPRPITLVGTARGGVTGISPLNLALPADTAAGDQILLAVAIPVQHDVDTPSGYTIVGTYTTGTADGEAKEVVYRRTATGADVNPHITVSFGTYGYSAVLGVYRGVDPTQPIETSSVGTTSGGLTVITPSITTTVPNDRLVVLSGETHSNSTPSWTPPAGMTERTSHSQPTAAAELADAAQPTPGGTGSKTSSLSGTTSANIVSVLISLQGEQYVP